KRLQVVLGTQRAPWRAFTQRVRRLGRAEVIVHQADLPRLPPGEAEEGAGARRGPAVSDERSRDPVQSDRGREWRRIPGTHASRGYPARPWGCADALGSLLCGPHRLPALEA